MTPVGESTVALQENKAKGMARVVQWFRPAPHVAGRTQQEIAVLYPAYRWRIFEAAFIAYATFYIVRNNFAPVSKEIGVALHYDKAMIGDILAGTAIAYGTGKL